MATFSEKSEAELASCHPDLQAILRAAIKITDFAVTKGHRGKEEQAKVYQEGVSRLIWPNSKHNSEPALAVDVAPYPVEWPDIHNDTARDYTRKTARFHYLAGIIMAIAHIMRIEIKWGGTYKTIFDGPHFELTEI